MTIVLTPYLSVADGVQKLKLEPQRKSLLRVRTQHPYQHVT